MSLLGIDVGTSAVKAVLVDPGVGVIAEASAVNDTASPRPGFAEADPAQWWESVCACTRKLAPRSPVDAIGVTGMLPAVLCLDADGRPLRPAILQSDARAGVEIAEARTALAGIDHVVLTGSALTQQSVIPTLAWLARHEPEVFAATDLVCGSYDWMAQRLGAEPHLEQNWAIESGLFLLDGMAPFAPARALVADLDRRIPPVRMPGDVVGELSAAAARATGLRAGTPIVCGGADLVTSAYAAGLAAPGDWLVKLGSSGDLLVVTDGPFVDPRTYLDAHVVPGSYLPNGCMATSGSMLRWLAALLGEGDLSRLDDEAAATPPGADGLVVLPYMLGEKSPLHDPDLRGVFAGLHLGHTRGHLWRAALEGIAFGFRHHVDVFSERAVTLAEFARVTNGGARSTLWKQVLADVLEVPLRPVIDHPGASLGTAYAAGIGVGAVADWRDIARIVRLGDPIEPRPSAVYADYYGTYRALEPAARDQLHRLAALSRLDGPPATG